MSWFKDDKNAPPSAEDPPMIEGADVTEEEEDEPEWTIRITMRDGSTHEYDFSGNPHEVPTPENYLPNGHGQIVIRSDDDWGIYFAHSVMAIEALKG